MQILNYLGRRIIEGDTRLLPQSGSPLTIDYGNLNTAFPELPRESRWQNPANLNLYKAVIQTETPPQAVQSLGLLQYRIRVCWREGQAEACTAALTYAPPGGGGGGLGPLPGVN
ncbi:hypothetical protein RLTM_02571 [Thermus parvatiensis]|uniref:Uncharacterized protein n=1 Tax=Thermus parvatiensis TaxID=456163 RepID=H7GEK0_9DEIN|nr:hypothetical protein [Thermus parvatiensis]EIA39597.1 hypothetical protein RLTM_02571 [Thermus parvatiensis]